MARFDLRLRIVASNLSEFTKKLKEEVSRAMSEAVGDRDNWKDFMRGLTSEIKSGMEEVDRRIGEIEKKKREIVKNLVDDILKGEEKVEPEKLLGVVGEGSEVKRGGVGGLISGLTTFLEGRSGILLAIFSIVGILGMMYDAVMKIVRMGETFSGYAQAVIKLLNVIFGLALKPIADVISVLLLPVLLALLRYVIIPWSKVTANVKKPEDVLKLADKGIVHGGLGSVGLAPVAAIIGKILDKKIGELFPKYEELKKMVRKYHVVEEGMGNVDLIKRIGVVAEKFVDSLSGVIRTIVGGIEKIRLPGPSVIASKVISFAEGLGEMFNVGRSKFIEYVNGVVNGFRIVKNYVSDLYLGNDSPVPVIVNSFVVIGKSIGSLISSGVIGRIVSSFVKISEALVSAEKVVKSYLESVINTAKGIGNWLSSLIRQAGGVAASLQSAIANAEATVSSVVSDISNAVSNAVSSVSSVVSSSVSNVASSSFSSVAESLSLDGALYNAAFGGGYQIGGFISKTGMYLLHSGEVVVPAWDVRKEERKYEVSININANVRSEYDIKRIAEEVERVLNDKMMRRGVLR